MMVALHTRVAADSIDEYEQAHREVPTELVVAIRAAGATSWRIWRSGQELFHLVECSDYPALLSGLRDLPVNIAWQQRMSTMLAQSHDYSEAGDDAGLPLVWSLEDEAPS